MYQLDNTQIIVTILNQNKDLQHKILQKKFSHPHLYQQRELSCPQFVEAVYLSNCFQPSFLGPEMRFPIVIKMRNLLVIENDTSLPEKVHH